MGPSIAQQAGKYKIPPTPTSLHPPATRVGEKIHIDGHQLRTPATGGYTHQYLCTDEYSGKSDVILCKSNQSRDVFSALDTLLRTEYEAFGHVPGTIRGDSESINLSLKTPLASRQPHPTLLQLNSPMIHAQYVERMTQTIAARARCTLSTLPYILPGQYSPYLDRAICHSLNNSIHDRIAPYTPHELAKGTKLSSIPLPFGRSCMIPTSEDKRRQEARILDTNWKTIPKVELGVVMGPDTTSNGTYFLTSNGKLVSRSTKRLRLLPRRFIPYTWRPRPYFPEVHLPLPNSPGLPPHILPPPTHPIFNNTIPLPPTSLVARSTPITGAQFNKQQAQRAATKRNRDFRRSLPFSTLTNAPTTIQPNPPPPQPRSEVNSKVAVSRYGYDKCREAEHVQLDKIINKYRSFRQIHPNQVEKDHTSTWNVSIQTKSQHR